ncbi:MAG: pantetheine-phosphate adenylyltransferase [Candidatus Sumerlaeia bacterium]|nr:pantetheine-phosphate adenylyltransferase [Candidatus Sumerlaeia bacterium]
MTLLSESINPVPAAHAEPSSRIALYPGSFDLVTLGHMDMIERSARLFDEVMVAVAKNSSKNPFFTVEERFQILLECTSHLKTVRVCKLGGLTIEFARQNGARFIIRGLRAVSDFEFELQIASMNHRMNPNIETIFLAAEPRHVFLSSRMVKDVWRNGGDVSEFVPAPVLNALNRDDVRARAHLIPIHSSPNS